MPPMPADDPTIADRLILRALIEDGLPSRAAHENWPIRQPWEFARAILDCVYRQPYEKKLAEPVFENITTGRLAKALQLALDVQDRGLPALEPLLAESAAMRQSD
jgi:hypothetical protein